MTVVYGILINCNYSIQSSIPGKITILSMNNRNSQIPIKTSLNYYYCLIYKQYS